jgi:hypothetical protein
MQQQIGFKRIAILIGILLLSVCVSGFAQTKQVFQATARGTGEQMGHDFGVEVTIESFSGPEDQKVLWDAFTQGGNQALAAALKKLPKRGSLFLSRGVPYDITYAREILAPDGSRVIRVVTNRFVTHAEYEGRAQWASDFDLSAVELNLSPEKGKSTGVFLPACQFTIDKEKGVQVELREYAWKLDWITEKTK